MCYFSCYGNMTKHTENGRFSSCIDLTGLLHYWFGYIVPYFRNFLIISLTFTLKSFNEKDEVFKDSLACFLSVPRNGERIRRHFLARPSQCDTFMRLVTMLFAHLVLVLAMKSFAQESRAFEWSFTKRIVSEWCELCPNRIAFEWREFRCKKI